MISPTSNADTSILIADTHIVSVSGHDMGRVPAKLFLELSPSPRVCISVERLLLPHSFVELFLKGDHWFDISLDNHLVVSAKEHSITCKPNETGLLCYGTFVLERNAVTIVETDVNLQSVAFSVINFVDFFFHLNGGISGGKDRTVRLRSSPWIIEIAAIDRIEQIAKSLGTEGGYSITHHGNIRRSDGGLFSVEDVRQLLEGIELFLSFAKGAHCGFPIVAGMNENGERVWQQVGINDVLIRSWRTAYTSWFDTWHGRILEDVFSGFWRWFESSEPNDPLRWALNWYILSNEAHVVEGGLILAMAALERLSYRSFSKRGQPGKRIASALKAKGIPVAIPLECPELAALQAKFQIQKDKKLEHGPHALVEIRDDLVHAEMDYGTLPPSAYYEAWNLGQWYAELMLLRGFGYDGYYGNRLKDRRRGQVEPVPWSKSNKASP